MLVVPALGVSGVAAAANGGHDDPKDEPGDPHRRRCGELRGPSGRGPVRLRPQQRGSHRLRHRRRNEQRGADDSRRSPSYGLRGIEIDPSGTTAYIGSDSGQVLLLDLPTRAFVGSITAGSAPSDIAFARNSAFAYVTDPFGGVLKLDTATRQVVGSPISVGGGSPLQIKITSAGFAYVVNNQSGFVSVIDLATDDVFAVIPVGAFPNGLALHPFLPIAYVANPCDAAGCSLSGSISVIDTPRGATSQPSSASPTNFAAPRTSRGRASRCERPQISPLRDAIRHDLRVVR